MGCCATVERPSGKVLSMDALASPSDLKLDFKYVIIGAGNAAGYAAKEFVESGMLKAGELCIIGSEKFLPYERPALTKGYMKGKADLPLFNTCAALRDRHEQKWYDSNGICVLTNTTVSDVNLKNKMIKTKNGREIKFEKCLAATGGRAIRLSDFNQPGAELDGIFYIRSYLEAKTLRTRLEEGKREEHIVIVGGGYIGTEMADCIVHYNFQSVTMVCSGEYIIDRVFPPEIAKIYEKALTERGITLLKGTRVSGFEGDGGKVNTVLLNNEQTLKADIVIVGVGGRANTELFQNQVDMEMRGIKVDGQMRSSVDDVYACGDIATFPIKCYGEMNRLEHVRSARATAMQAARSMLGIEQKDIDLVPVFYSRFFDLDWEMYGKKTGRTFLFGLNPDSIDQKQFGCVWLDNENRLFGVLMQGTSKEDGKRLEELVRKQDVVPGKLLESGATDELKAYILGGNSRL